jgi:RsiW-degrading membrane proteinase PrsW (M82 family)
MTVVEMGPNEGRDQSRNLLQESKQDMDRLPSGADHFTTKWIVPCDAATFFKVLRTPGTWMMLLFGLAPLAFNSAAGVREQLLLFLVVYFSLAWGAYFYVFLTKQTSNLWIGIGTAVFTILIGVPFGRLLKHTLFSPFYSLADSSSGAWRLLGDVFSHGLTEELLKALPILLLTFAVSRIKRPVDGAFYGALSGLGFAAWEGYKFMVQSQGSSEALMETLLRTTTLPFLHASFSAIAGYFIALSRFNRQRLAVCATGIATAAVLHGFYDFESRTGQVVVAACTFLLLALHLNQGLRTTRNLATGTDVPEREVGTAT